MALVATSGCGATSRYRAHMGDGVYFFDLEAMEGSFRIQKTDTLLRFKLRRVGNRLEPFGPVKGLEGNRPFDASGLFPEAFEILHESHDRLRLRAGSREFDAVR